MNIIEDNLQVVQAVLVGLIVAKFLANTGRALKSIELCKECLIFLNNEVPGKKAIFDKLSMEGSITFFLASMYKWQCKYAEARELYDRAINITKETGDRKGQANAYDGFGTMSYHLKEYVQAKEYFEKALAIRIEICDREGQAEDYGNLAMVFQSLGEYDKAKEYNEKALVIRIENGERQGEAGDAYQQSGIMFFHLDEYVKARECLEKALAIRIEIGDRTGEASCYANLGTVFFAIGEFEKAREYLEKALAIRIETEERQGEAGDAYEQSGIVFFHLDEYVKARECLEKALAIRIEIGDRAGEASCYGNLGTVFISVGEYENAREYLEKALAIRIETGYRAGEAADYGNLGTVFTSLCQYDTARKYLEKALAIRIEIGDRAGEALDYGNLGPVFLSIGEYDKAREYLEKALAIRMEIGDRAGEAKDYGNLGNVFRSLGEYDKAKEYFEKALAISIEIGDRNGKASSYGNLGKVFYSLAEFNKAREYHEKALAIRTEIGDRRGEAADHGNIGTVFHYLGEYDKARDYFEKALAISIEIGDKKGEASSYGTLGTFFQFFGEHDMAEINLEKALSISKNIKDLQLEFQVLCNLTHLRLVQEKMEEAFDCLHLCVSKSEEMHGFMRDNDQFKISLLDVHEFPYQTLSALFCSSGNPNNALYVLELSRARALADLMATQYSVEMQISANPQSWIGIEGIIKTESNCVCLYISYYAPNMLLWILKSSGVICFRRRPINENFAPGRLTDSLDDFYAKSFGSFGILSEEDCEDRSLNDIESKLESWQEENLAAWRLVEDDDEEIKNVKSSLSLYYRMVIAPVADLLDQPEIIIVPDRSLNLLSFASLTNEGGKYLSDTFRIRIVPSLSTLKLIKDSPAGYHSQTGALIVGDPEVGRVLYRGRRITFAPLPCARKEAEMIGELLGVQPLSGKCATKQAVLERLHSVSLIHFAAHGNAERGEIALSPQCSSNGIPHEEDYLLTLSDISQVGLRAKLVVLSCCHSGCGQIRAEGVVGIARAFLGSGARSVLVALWAIKDGATEQFMRRFYEHLARGDSASESLHETMKWMRGNKFPKVDEWAPFTLIGDNVTFDFVK